VNGRLVVVYQQCCECVEQEIAGYGLGGWWSGRGTGRAGDVMRVGLVCRSCAEERGDERVQIGFPREVEIQRLEALCRGEQQWCRFVAPG
jgi:hypothetical protein